MIIDAGYSDGFEVELALSAHDPVLIDLAEMCVDMWSEVGVTATMYTQEAGAHYGDLFAYTYKDISSTDWGGDPGPEEKLVLTMSDPRATANFPRYEDEYLAEEYWKARATVDFDERIDIWKPLMVYFLEKATWIGFPTPHGLHCWWPWLKNYYGEVDVGSIHEGHIIARIWIDQELKAKLGY